MAPLPYVYAVNLVYAVNMPHDANGVNMRQDGPVNERRRAYHHGDLANALTNAATELARHGGPGAVGLRESPRENSLAMVESPAFTMLPATLDELTGLGLIPRARRPYTEMVAWSSAHGLAALIADGPLAAFPEEEREAAINRTLDATIEAICTGA